MKKNYTLFTFGLIVIAINSLKAQCPTPSLVTASPSTLCAAGATTTLNATASGASINWFTVPVGGVAIGSSASAANFSINPSVTTTYYAESFVTGGSTTNYTYTGAFQSYTVPAGVTQMTITAIGAAGGTLTANGFHLGGFGASMRGVFTVVPGNVLKIMVGGKGFPDPSTSGGGGASGVSIAGAVAIVAGGGGGVDFQQPTYANIHASLLTAGNMGGGSNPGGVAGADGSDAIYSSVNISRGGRGWNFNNNGSFGLNGTSVLTTTTVGTFGIGGGGGSVGYGYCNCGGGGGGYSGGGAGLPNSTGGGGGSINNGTSQLNTAMVGTGNGTVTIVISGSACTSSARTPVTVSVGSTPTISATSGAICAGNSFTIVPSGASTYSYSGGSAVVTPTANTNYSVTGTNSLGCVGSNTAVSSVTVNANPSVTSSTSNSIICVGQNAVLTASTSATSYTWNTGATTLSVSVSPTVTSTYTVSVSNAAACVATSTITVTVSLCTGINENYANSISVYPNPNNGILNINLTSALTQNSSLEVYDAIGKLVVKQTLTSELNVLNISNLDNGIYTFKVLNNSTLIKIGKIVKQ